VIKSNSTLQFPASSGDFSSKTVNQSNPDHHIWSNNGTWWCHLTVYKAGYIKERIRVSLGTKCREEARLRRDILWRALRAMTDVTGSPSIKSGCFLPHHLKQAA
jgi:hypothetical protein